MGVTTYQFASLYSWYSWPNVVLPIFGGYLIDRVLGLRIGAAFFAFILILGKKLIIIPARSSRPHTMICLLCRSGLLCPWEFCGQFSSHGNWSVHLWHWWRILGCGSKHLRHHLVFGRHAQHGFWSSIERGSFGINGVFPGHRLLV